jgi:hypothetical protein
MTLPADRTDKQPGSGTRTRLMVIFAIVIILCLMVFYFSGKKPRKEEQTVVRPKADTSMVREKKPPADTGSKTLPEKDTTKTGTVAPQKQPVGRAARSAADSSKRAVKSADSLKAARVTADSVRAAERAADSIKSVQAADSEKVAQSANDSARVRDSSSIDSDAVFFGNAAPVDCANDTVVPWVYPEPSGGLYHGAVSVRFLSNKKCSIRWRPDHDTVWQRYDDKALSMEKTMTIFFKAVDRCGRTMEERKEYYEIDLSPSGNVCPKSMDLVKIGNMRFCIDRYEWPGKKGVVPESYVTLYQAKDSCFTAGKRLCTSEEWSLACSGPYSWKYPYGQTYEPRACVTSDTAVRPSGTKPECRSFFGSFDMSGNLLEWTSTTSRGSPGYYNVLGGFWQSGVRSGCFDIRSSYFPQNRHNPVGFRCCKDAPAEVK